MKQAHWIDIGSPLGDIALRIENARLTGLFFVGQKHFPARTVVAVPPDDASRSAATWGASSPLAVRARGQIADYFAGRLQTFDLPLAPHGSAFELAVWQQLATIPYGTVTTYGAIAKRLGLAPGYARAVGAAVGKNPLSILIPCHRVLGAGGQLTGYAGGLPRKQALLDLEASVVALQSTQAHQAATDAEP
ncbi:MAG: methylated-DNA--[protein]-cysteine S-methyltransferase [Thiomonas sp.]|nr:methylated-DNA--[protein]-cysteine S-methyltransferase [Thiomonas sp.]